MRAEELAGGTDGRRAARAAEIIGRWEAVRNDEWIGHGHASPSAWMAAATGDPYGECKRALHLGRRLAVMRETRRVFELGLLSEQIVGVLADAWAEPIADVFVRDELILVVWAKRLPYAEAKLVIETWVAHADPDRIERSGADSFEARRLHLS